MILDRTLPYLKIVWQFLQPLWQLHFQQLRVVLSTLRRFSLHQAPTTEMTLVLLLCNIVERVATDTTTSEGARYARSKFLVL